MNILLIILCLFLAFYSLYCYTYKKSNLRVITPLMIVVILLTVNALRNKPLLIQSEKISLNQVKELVANS